LSAEAPHRKLLPMSLPPSLPLPPSLQTWLWIRHPTQLMKFWSQRYGAAYRLRLPMVEFNLFSDPESIRRIFAAKPHEMHAGEVNSILRPLVGNSSTLLLDGDEHLRHRKLLAPSFHGERMRLYGDTMVKITRDVIARFPEAKPFALHPHTQDITLQVILRTVFGADEGAELDALSSQMKNLLSLAQYRVGFLAMAYLSMYPRLERHPLVRPLLARRDRTDALLYQIIRARRADPHAKQRQDVLATLMQATDEQGQPMTDAELRDELITALAAGHETTATALAWAFERVLSHPHVYRRLRTEVADAGGADASPETLVTLPYLDATIKEVMRLRPVVPIVGRVLKQPVTLAGYDLPEGAAVGACIYLAQRNPNLYSNPETFQPERFLGVTPDPTHWLPFGGGIRRCIGAPFATYEMKIVMGTLLAHCGFELAQKAPARALRRVVTFFPEHGTRVRLVSRTAPVACKNATQAVFSGA